MSSTEPDKAIVIGISGPSSSGKTTLARLLQSVFSGILLGDDNKDGKDKLHTFIIHEDDFYFPDDKIPIVTLTSGNIVQDWDCIGAIDISFLTSALSYVRTNGHLPPRLKSKEDLNEESDSGVGPETIAQLRADVEKRLLQHHQQKKQGNDGGGGGGGLLWASSTPLLAFLEGILLFSPPNTEVKDHVLRPVHRNIDLHLFLPAAYDVVKARRESRSGYVTAGPAPVPSNLDNRPSAEKPEEVDLQAEDDGPPQNFWTDPPGYVDDIVWPRYVQDHAWLLLPENEQQSQGTDDLIKRIGSGTKVRTDAGVIVAPGWGSKPVQDILKWAVEEIMSYLLAQ